MACALTPEQIIDLYEVIYGEIVDRISDKKLPTFNVETLIKEVYENVDESKALIYAQAVPDILKLVSNDEAVSQYLRELRKQKLLSQKLLSQQILTRSRKMKQLILHEFITMLTIILHLESKLENLLKKNFLMNLCSFPQWNLEQIAAHITIFS